MATATTTTKSTTTTPARLLRTEIEQYLSLADRKSQLEREARAVGKQMEPLSDRFIAYVDGELCRNRKAKFVKSCGYVLSIVASGVYPAWKKEFIAELGENAAAYVIENTPPSLGLQIEPE